MNIGTEHIPFYDLGVEVMRCLKAEGRSGGELYSLPKCNG